MYATVSALVDDLTNDDDSSVSDNDTETVQSTETEEQGLKIF